MECLTSHQKFTQKNTNSLFNKYSELLVSPRHEAQTAAGRGPSADTFIRLVSLHHRCRSAPPHTALYNNSNFISEWTCKCHVQEKINGKICVVQSITWKVVGVCPVYIQFMPHYFLTQCVIQSHRSCENDRTERDGDSGHHQSHFSRVVTRNHSRYLFPLYKNSYNNNHVSQNNNYEWCDHVEHNSKVGKYVSEYFMVTHGIKKCVVFIVKVMNKKLKCYESRNHKVHQNEEWNTTQ